MTITDNERDLLLAIVNSEYGDSPADGRWVDCIWGWEGTKKYPGTMASLVSKGLVHTDGEVVTLKPLGWQTIRDTPNQYTKYLAEIDDSGNYIR